MKNCSLHNRLLQIVCVSALSMILFLNYVININNNPKSNKSHNAKVIVNLNSLETELPQLSSSTAELKISSVSSSATDDNQLSVDVLLVKRIKTFLVDEKYKYILPALPFEPRWILIITTWRSGSSFTAQLLSSLRGANMHYEPLMEFEFEDLLSKFEQRRKAEEMIQDLFTCQYQHPSLKNYLELEPEEMRQYIFSKNERVWDLCLRFSVENNTQFCYNPIFLQEACQLFPVQVVKVVRLPLSSAVTLLSTLTNLKVIYLVRDPRASLHSRQELDWCVAQPRCIRTESLCDTLADDSRLAVELQRKFRNHFTILRYEDLAENPEKVSRKLFEWLELPWMPEVKKYILDHTVRNGDDAEDSTHRQSSSRIARWMNNTNWNYIQNVQTTCKVALDAFGYVLIQNVTMINANISFQTVYRQTFLYKKLQSNYFSRDPIL